MGYYNKGSVEEALQMLGLSDAADKPAGSYSLGMKQRLGSARAILCKPELVILDEPTNGLDPAGMKQIRDLFRILCTEYGMTLMISSHLLPEIESIADTVGVKMNLMFSYPIKRQKILASQMIAVWIFNLAALILTKLAIYMCVFFGAKFMQSSVAVDFSIGSLSFYIQLILKSVVIVSMSFIALFVGMALKSSKATIVTSFLLIFLTQANIIYYAQPITNTAQIFITAQRGCLFLLPLVYPCKSFTQGIIGGNPHIMQEQQFVFFVLLQPYKQVISPLTVFFSYSYPAPYIKSLLFTFTIDKAAKSKEIAVKIIGNTALPAIVKSHRQ